MIKLYNNISTFSIVAGIKFKDVLKGFHTCVKVWSIYF